MAPELYENKYVDENGQKVGKNVDVWAVGVMTFQLLSDGQMPFRREGELEPDKDDLKHRICNESPCWELFGGNDHAKKFVARCLEKDWRKRASSNTLERDDWLKIAEFSVAPKQVA